MLSTRIRKPCDKWDIVSCPSCKALLWNAEATGVQPNRDAKQFSLCCQRGRVRLPPVREPPSPLLELLETPKFRSHIRVANSLLAFTSMGAQIDHSVTGTPGPFTFRVHGQIIHRIGSMLPDDGNDPEYLQLYIFDTDNELENRKRSFTKGSSQLAVDDTVILQLIEMLDINNHLAKTFRHARDRSWRLFAFPIHYNQPNVVKLPVHLPGDHVMVFDESADLSKVVYRENIDRSMLTAFFEACDTYEEARELTY
ncbi:hypothetical protein HID58_086749, partial [Brassica napus]